MLESDEWENRQDGSPKALRRGLGPSGHHTKASQQLSKTSKSLIGVRTSPALTPQPRSPVSNGVSDGDASVCHSRLEHVLPEGHTRASQNIMSLRFMHPSPHLRTWSCTVSGGEATAQVLANKGRRLKSRGSRGSEAYIPDMSLEQTTHRVSGVRAGCAWSPDQSRR